ncbi:MAG: hypothetical protein HYS45_00075 [Parcubacteria group bacterium]|nr:hypothetical protein [Parcubacteria group bacterium]MBI2636675.1 hypothetical protein [Parcubacteria group bacterium]
MGALFFSLALAVSACWIPGGFVFWEAGVHPLGAFPLSFAVAFVLDGVFVCLSVLAMELTHAPARRAVH